MWKINIIREKPLFQFFWYEKCPASCFPCTLCHQQFHIIIIALILKKQINKNDFFLNQYVHSMRERSKLTLFIVWRSKKTFLCADVKVNQSIAHLCREKLLHEQRVAIEKLDKVKVHQRVVYQGIFDLVYGALESQFKHRKNKWEVWVVCTRFFFWDLIYKLYN